MRERLPARALLLAVLLGMWAGAAAALVQQDAATIGRYQRLELTVPYLRFPDVPWEHWALGSIEACAEAEIVRGYDDSTYRPAETIDRGQMAVYIARALAGGDEHVPSGPSVPTFPDVPADHWAYKYVEYAVANGVVQGFPEGDYRPDLTVDRGQMAVYIARAIATPTGEAGLIGYLPPATPTFPDVPAGHWAFKYVEYIHEHGVAGGYPDGTYRPDYPCSRDQMAVYVARAFGLPAAGPNPYDPDHLALAGLFTTPSSEQIEVPGFYHRPFTRMLEEGYEELTSAGAGSFKIRFAWHEIGDYTFQVVARTPGGETLLGSGAFSVTPSASLGYVRPSPTAPLYFEFDSGDPYFAIGENMCWPADGGTYDYDDWLTTLADHGGNYIRLWLINEWNPLGLEHLPLYAGDDNGLGRYDQQASWRVDYILSLADQLDVKVMMSIDSFNMVQADEIYSQWDRSPYNQANGGPCANPWDFFTDPDARRLFKQRLRYLLARWGYATSVLSWEFWNEVDLATGYNSTDVAAWHQEMAIYLRGLDPWAHLLTTSFAYTDGDPAVDSLACLDYVQSHNYGSHDIAGMVDTWSRRKVADYGKPHYFGEFGAHWLPDENATDPDGIHLHNGLWASTMSKSAGAAMLWWWDNYVDPNHLYDHFAALAAFTADVDWIAENYDYAQVADLSFAPGHEPSTYADLAIDPPAESWEEGAECNQPHTYVVHNDGTVDDLVLLSRVQHGLVNHPTWHNPATFQVTYPAPGGFEVLVAGVSGWGGAALTITVDGEEVLAADFPDTLLADHEDMHQYDGAYGVDITAGPHTIVVENPGTDWFYVSYRLTNYITSPNLRVLGLANPTSALVWVQNKMHTWWNHREGVDPEPVNLSLITLSGFTPGLYTIERWDTYTGAPAAEPPYNSTDGTIVLQTPDGLLTDVGYKVRPAS